MAILAPDAFFGIRPFFPFELGTLNPHIKRVFLIMTGSAKLRCPMKRTYCDLMGRGLLRIFPGTVFGRAWLHDIAEIKGWVGGGTFDQVADFAGYRFIGHGAF